MTLIRTNHRNGFPTVPALFNDLFTRDLWNWNLENASLTGTTVPSVNIKETDNHFEVEMAAPGMKKDDFSIELDGNLLSITSEKESKEEEKEGDKYSRKEFSYQSFTRSFQLPKDVVDADKIEAKYENGVLNLVIPKKEEAKQKAPRLIKIS
jgi:HSP20 family protein